MFILIVILIFMIAGILLLRKMNKSAASKDAAAVAHAPQSDAGKKDCDNSKCNVFCFCAGKTLQSIVSTEILYYDDEELDAYRGIAANGYTDAQIDKFSEVLTTLRPGEVSDWLNSLRLRNIALPEALNDEAFMIMQENK